jgi:hypothetical protein
MLLIFGIALSYTLFFTSVKFFSPSYVKPYEWAFIETDYEIRGEFTTLYCSDGSTDSTTVIFYKGERVREQDMGCFHNETVFNKMSDKLWAEYGEAHGRNLRPATDF